jgi:DNA helicase HerA-like ATPase
MREIIGKVLDKAGTESFQFVSNKFFSDKFVEVRIDHISSGAKIIGEVIEREAVNSYFERPTDIRYVKEGDESVSTRSLYISNVRLLAVIMDGRRSEFLCPPLPGSNVYVAEEPDIKLALELEDKGIDVGFIKGYNLSFKISPVKLFKTHIGILGQTGGGKSYLAAKFAIELLRLRHVAKVPSQIAVPIIFDSSGEYAGKYDAGEQRNLSLIMETISLKEQSFPLLNKKYLPLLYEIYDIDEREENDLRIWLSDENISQAETQGQQQFLKQDAKQLITEFHQLRITSTEQLANKLGDYLSKFNKLNPPEKMSVPYAAIRKMRKFSLRIKKSDDMGIAEQLSDGLIVNLSELDSYEERQITMFLFLRQLYEAAKAKKINSRIVLFIDEAHNYVPSIYKSFCKDEILRLAREGRKYGISLCLISQRPRWVDPTALSQCGNLFIFRIQNSDDKKHILDSASLPDIVKDINIAKFKTGEMIITGDVAIQPINCIVSQIDHNFIVSMANIDKTKAVETIKIL